MLHIEKVGCMKDKHNVVAYIATSGGSGRLSLKYTYGEHKQERQCYGRMTHASEHAPNTSTAASPLQPQPECSALEQGVRRQSSNRRVHNFHRVHHRNVAPCGPQSASQLEHAARISGGNNVGRRC